MFFLTGNLPADAMPVRVESNSKVFSIPFELHPDTSGDPVQEVELMVSTDSGTRWYAAVKVPVKTKKIDFRAEQDGEYWFSFRTITLSGIVKQTGTGPQLRVLVDTAVPQESAAVPPTPSPVSAQPPVSEGVITPPKPMRVKDEKTVKTEEPKFETGTEAKPVQKMKPAAMPQLISPDGTVAEVKPAAKPALNQSESDVMVQQLLNGMDKFYDGTLKDIKPVPQKQATPKPPVASNAAGKPPLPPEKPVQPGSITGISLNQQGQQPQLVVKWNTGGEQWKDAQVDVLRSFNGQEPFFPVAINLDNTGQYWWFLSAEDFKPFYLRIRIRSTAGIFADSTKTPIHIPRQ
jgi:hypothetical protein